MQDLDDLHHSLVTRLGAEIVVVDREPYARDDGAEGPFPPGLVLRPQQRSEIAEIVALCRAHRIPLSPRGAGTGTVGACLADHGGVVLDLAGLDAIIDIDGRSLLATVEPGVITARLQAEATALGLFYPPDPASFKKCSLGGNIATNAGGPRACKYGVTGAFVLGLDVITGAGQRLSLGHRSLKGVTGYDLVSLLVGSEGTLAVTETATLRLLPRPSASLTLLATFSDEIAACDAVLRCLRGGLTPAAIEFADRTCADLLLRGGDLHVHVPKDTQSLLWIELDGDAAGLDAALQRAAKRCDEAGALSVESAADPATCERLWDLRRALSYRLRAHWPKKISEDVAVPIGRLPELAAAARTIASRHRLDSACFGHAGDGNLHVNFLYDPASADDIEERVQRAVTDLFRATLQLGGTLSGEHGIGLSKRPYMHMEQPAALRDLQLALKRVWDPHHLLNPGKIFPSC